jgi:hypothetical protein
VLHNILRSCFHCVLNNGESSHFKFDSCQAYAKTREDSQLLQGPLVGFTPIEKDQVKKIALALELDEVYLLSVGTHLFLFPAVNLFL